MNESNEVIETPIPEVVPAEAEAIVPTVTVSDESTVQPVSPENFPSNPAEENVCESCQ